MYSMDQLRLDMHTAMNNCESAGMTNEAQILRFMSGATYHAGGVARMLNLMQQILQEMKRDQDAG